MIHQNQDLILRLFPILISFFYQVHPILIFAINLIQFEFHFSLETIIPLQHVFYPSNQDITNYPITKYFFRKAFITFFQFFSLAIFLIFHLHSFAKQLHELHPNYQLDLVYLYFTEIILFKIFLFLLQFVLLFLEFILLYLLLCLFTCAIFLLFFILLLDDLFQIIQASFQLRLLLFINLQIFIPYKNRLYQIIILFLIHKLTQLNNHPILEFVPIFIHVQFHFLVVNFKLISFLVAVIRHQKLIMKRIQELLRQGYLLNHLKPLFLNHQKSVLKQF